MARDKVRVSVNIRIKIRVTVMVKVTVSVSISIRIRIKIRVSRSGLGANKVLKRCVFFPLPRLRIIANENFQHFFRHWPCLN